jgi:septum formation protein
LLRQLGVPFTIVVAAIVEQRWPGEPPQAYATRMAQEKAQHVAQQFPTALVLGADTVVVLDEDVLGKPRDVAHARQMLQRLSGRTHTVITGLALLQDSQGLHRLDAVRTQVVFRSLTELEINAYLATGEPFDKAGAYAIQGRGGAFVASCSGCYTNVIGLPLQRTAALLRAAALPVSMPPAHNAKTAW